MYLCSLPIPETYFIPYLDLHFDENEYPLFDLSIDFFVLSIFDLVPSKDHLEHGDPFNENEKYFLQYVNLDKYRE